MRNSSSAAVHNAGDCLNGHLDGRFAYYREVGDWEGNFPMQVRITSASGEILQDVIAGAFTALSCACEDQLDKAL